jgi:hypothetical protein
VLGLRARAASVFMLSQTETFSEESVMSQSLLFQRRRQRGGPRVRLQVEPLESRDVPSNFTPGSLVPVSGPSPFLDCQPPNAYGLNAETEPWVAVNPKDPNNLVAAWIQDRAMGIVAGVSTDGGASWQDVVVPGLTACSGGTYPTAADPWVSFAPNGDVYVSSIENHFFQHNHGNAIRVNKSTDGGRTWGAPVTLIEDTSSGFNFDKPSITSDPTNANTVYAIWNRSDQGQRFTRSQTLFTRTTDGGRTWEPARAIYTPGNDNGTIGDQVVVRPDGTLLDFFAEQLQHGTHDDFQLSVLRSTDGGLTWSAPVRAAQMLGNVVIDPETGQPVTTAGEPPPLFDVAQDPANGNLYAVWEDARFSNAQHTGIAFSMSTDGGLSWSAPVQINKTPTGIASVNQNAFLPSVAVAADGTVGVTYYDFRNNDASPGLLTDYWFIHADPRTDLTNPANWCQEIRLTDTPFDIEKAPLSNHGLFVGDYEGLVAAGNAFVPVWSMPHPNADGTTDLASVFSRRLSSGAPVPAASIGANPVGQTGAAPPAGALLAPAMPGRPAAGTAASSLTDSDFRSADLGGAPPGLASGPANGLDSNTSRGGPGDATPHDSSPFTTPASPAGQSHIDRLNALGGALGDAHGSEQEDAGALGRTPPVGTRRRR